MPTDLSERSAGAFDWVRKQADALDAPIHCVYVAPDATTYLGQGLAAAAVSLPKPGSIRQIAKEKVEQFLAERAVDVTKTVILQGKPFVEIIRYARDENAAMIIMSTHGYTGLKHVLMGSTTESVVRKATCPVLSVPSEDVWFELP